MFYLLLSDDDNFIMQYTFPKSILVDLESLICPTCMESNPIANSTYINVINSLERAIANSKKMINQMLKRAENLSWSDLMNVNSKFRDDLTNSSQDVTSFPINISIAKEGHLTSSYRRSITHTIASLIHRFNDFRNIYITIRNRTITILRQFTLFIYRKYVWWAHKDTIISSNATFYKASLNNDSNINLIKDNCSLISESNCTTLSLPLMIDMFGLPEGITLQMLKYCCNHIKL
jgi:hypothetical protein